MFKPDLMIDLQWLQRISFRLDKFKKGGGRNKYLCRCPYCGDSKKSKKKTRLQFYTVKTNLNFICYNCGERGSFYKFMKEIFKGEFEEYKKEQLFRHFDRFDKKDKKPIVETQQEEEEIIPEVCSKSFYDLVVPISQLEDTHPAKKYLIDRKFTEVEWNRLYYAENFKNVAEFISPTKLSDKFPEEGRIVIPFFDESGDNITMVQGRSLKKDSNLKYISIKSHSDVEKVFGLDTIDRTKTVYCVEGPLDSLFIDNCIASADASLTRVKADVYIFDNQPRNEEICDLIEKAINEGHKVVIWDHSPNEKEDINDYIKKGISRELLAEYISARTFQKAFARMEFSKWKRV